MRLATFRIGGAESFGVVAGEQVVDVGAAAEPLAEGVDSLLQLIAAGPKAITACAAIAEHALRDVSSTPVHDLRDVELLAPLPRPPKVLCVGRNYHDHVGEIAAELPPFPSTFAKLPNNVIGSGASIVLPPMSHKVDYEAELAVIIGRRATNVSVERALDYVAGYAILDDVSARDIQVEQKQLTVGKNFRTFAPFGPWITTPDEVGNPADLGIRLWLNGELMQDGNTSAMIFSAAEIIAFLSEVTDLEPGDVISTGTPAGVGMGRSPQIFLKPGDLVTIEIDKLGRLENPVVAADGSES